MKEEPNNNESEEWQLKKTRKTKAAVPTATNRNTRRARRRQSDEQCVLPQFIPRSESNQMLLFQSFQCETTRLILQIPISMLSVESFTIEDGSRVETSQIKIQITKETDNMVCNMKLQTDEDAVILTHGKYSWLCQTQIQSKLIKSCRKILNSSSWTELFRFKIGEAHSDLFIILSLKLQERQTTDYVGLVNQGNTCYMNSYLQMLFHITQFRTILFACEPKEKEKFPATLQLLFCKMLREEKAVSPEELIRSFGWSKKEMQIQQDAQEFSCLFFDALERTIEHVEQRWSSVPQLFCGEIVHYIQCLNVGIFRTQNRQRFYDLQLPIANNLAASLDEYVGEQTLDEDNAYRTEIYGLQAAKKGLRLSYLPPVLMLQLKRFQFNPYSESNEKILDYFSYPQEIDFSSWTMDSSHEKTYDLYAVLVHQGTLASSGHYYVYIKLFNDERVEAVSKQKAVEYNFGGNADVLEYDTKQMKVNMKQIQNKATAYMLVYVSRQLRGELLNITMKDLPQWVKEYNKNKECLEEQKKLKKQSICDLVIYTWKRHLESKQCSGFGLIASQDEEEERKIEMVPKSMKMEQWLEKLEQIMPQQTPYVYWQANDKEILVNVKARPGIMVSQLFKQVLEPSLIFFPVNAEKQQYLVVIKIFNKNIAPEISFHDCITVSKGVSHSELYFQLVKLFQPKLNHNYYIEDKKVGLVKLQSCDLTLLNAPSPSRNQLLVVVVQQLAEGEQSGKLMDSYKDQLNTVEVFFRNESNKVEVYPYNLNKYTSVEQLRKTLFSDILKQNQLYQSPNNIILKYKSKKNGKPNVEAQDNEQLKDLIRVDSYINFSFSNLNVAERLVMRELTFYCRGQDHLQLNDPHKIVIEKSEQQSKMYQIIKNNEAVQKQLPFKQDYALRMFLLGKDKSIINDLIDQNGYVIGKGQLATILQREKNSLLVIEQYKIIKEECEHTNVLVHHITKTGERFGNPRWLRISKKMALSDLKVYVLQLIEHQSYQFEGKVRVLAYVKDISKAIELLEQQQIVTAKMQAQQPQPSEQVEESLSTIESRFSKSKLLRICVVHNSISKGTQALKLNVE